MHLAVIYADTQMVELLLEAGANVNAEDAVTLTLTLTRLNAVICYAMLVSVVDSLMQLRSLN